MESAAPTSVQNECRQCCSFCDRVVHPSGCIAGACPYLYSYDEERSGRRYMGCLNKVFKVEIDVELLDQAQRTRQGYGGVRMTGSPLPQCEFSVEQAYAGRGEAFECVNPRFFDAPDTGPDAYRAFDLRDSL